MRGVCKIAPIQLQGGRLCCILAALARRFAPAVRA